MGKEVSYCQTCGDRLGVGESVESQVYIHDGRRYCAVCRPAQATTMIPLPDRRKSSTKMRAPAPAARVKETTRLRKRSGGRLTLLAGSAVALAIGIALAAGGRGSDTPAPRPQASRSAELTVPEARPAPKAEPGPTLDELLARIREIRQSDLMFERRDEVHRLLQEAAGTAGGRREEVDLLAAEVDRKFEEAAARLADFTRSEAARMAAKQKFAEAIERLDGYPAAFRASKAAASLRLLREDYERRRTTPSVEPPASASPPKQMPAPWQVPVAG